MSKVIFEHAYTNDVFHETDVNHATLSLISNLERGSIITIHKLDGKDVVLRVTYKHLEIIDSMRSEDADYDLHIKCNPISE